MPTKDKPLAINKGIELMLRRAKKDQEPIPMKGFGINNTFSFFKRKFYINFDVRWEKQ